MNHAVSMSLDWLVQQNLWEIAIISVAAGFVIGGGVICVLAWVLAQIMLSVRDWMWERKQFRGLEIRYPDGRVEREKL
jgi:hypothetical protein